MAQINPPAGSGFSSYTDIIRLDKTGIMGLSSAPGLANRFSQHTRNSEKKSYKKKNLHATGEIFILWCTYGQYCEFLFTPGKNKDCACEDGEHDSGSRCNLA